VWKRHRISFLKITFIQRRDLPKKPKFRRKKKSFNKFRNTPKAFIRRAVMGHIHLLTYIQSKEKITIITLQYISRI